MRTRMELVGSGERVREVADILLELRDRRDDDPETVLLAAPELLFDAFSPERMMEEAEAWLVRWRAAADKVELDAIPVGRLRAGCTGSRRTTTSGLGEISVDTGGGRAVVTLKHDDDPIPYEALRWLALAAGLEIGDEFRVA